MKKGITPLKEARAKARVLTAFIESVPCGLIFTLLYALPHRGLSFRTAAEGLLIWSDAFTLSGVLLMLLSGAFKLDRIGMWDWLMYALYQTRFLLRRHKDESYTNFHDYKKLRERSSAPLWPWLLTGTVWIAAGVILGVLYYSK